MPGHKTTTAFARRILLGGSRRRFEASALLVLITAMPLSSVVWSQESAATSTARELALSFPGAQVAVWRDGKVVDRGRAGWSDVAARKEVETETTFPVFSAAKAWTVAALGVQVVRGTLDLNSPIEGLVPSFSSKRWSPTPMQLATHSGGVRHYSSPAEAEKPRRCETVDEALKLFDEDPLEYEPGTDRRYSSWGFVLLSAVIEAASGQAFDATLRETVLDPAGMIHSFSASSSDSLRALSYGIFSDERGTTFELVEVDPSCKWGAGGYVATASDLVSFYGALHGGDLLPPALAAQIVRPGPEGSFRFGGSSLGGMSQVVGDWGRGVFVAIAVNARADVDLAAPAQELLSLELSSGSQHSGAKP